MLVEAVFDVDQRRGDVQQRALARGRPRVHHGLQVARLALHLVAQFAEAEHAERVADLAQQLQLRLELVACVPPWRTKMSSTSLTRRGLP